ncbi:BTAD domain-containing putative transcriptional regulator [Lentzea sp. NPDC003310]|uniref:AfsR/SARP family transcriptional regulator n=1 Tax=Lentzea sp. NPDC003310 TaxID=3154447 RepID=UPI0033B851DB
MIVEYRVLGPLEVLVDGDVVTVPAGRGRVLLATLLLRANEFVSVDELVDRVWDGEPPAPDRAHKSLQTVVMRLRQALGPANCVRTSARGYTAEVDPERLDLTRFRRLTAQGEHRAALELWRGPVLADVPSEALRRDDVPRLVEERAVALERRFDEELTGPTDRLVPELRELTEQHPFREVFWAQLVLALHRADRQAEALAAYDEIRARLADDLGVDPGRRLREAHDEISRSGSSAAVPRQLPLTHSRFVGRERELARLSEALRSRRDQPVLISAINGVGGVGKTSLAVHWAHRVAHHFPDGQIYVNLRGFDSRAEPVRPLAAISRILPAFGVPVGDLRADALVSYYRSVLAERKVLLLLDNARDADQVRPLLPGGTSNLVLITSRNQLRGLVAREGARPVALDVLDERGGLDLLTSRIGAERIAAEPEAAARLVVQCAGLPLALSIVAARAATDDSLTGLADELALEGLDALDVDDFTGVRAVFSWSLRSLSEDAAHLFVLLGLHPGPDFAAAAAASLAALPLPRTRKLLGELVAGSLVDTGSDGRFALHDLVRDFAAERAAALPAASRAEAVRRMFDHYLHTSHAAWRLLQFNAAPVVTTPPAPGVLVEPVPDADVAWARFEAEYRVLLSAVDRASDLGEDDFAWKTMFTLHDYLSRQGHIHDAATGHRLGLAAAERLGDMNAQSLMHRRLASTQISFDDFAASEFHLREAIRCAQPGGDVPAEAHLRRGLAFAYEKQGRFADAFQVLAEIHPRMADHPDPYESGRHLAALGRAHHKVGQSDRALELCTLAAEKFAESGFNGQDAGPAGNLETLGEIYLHLGRHAEAFASYERAVAVWRQMRAMTDVADCLILQGEALIEVGEPVRARECLIEALTIAESLLDRENFEDQVQRARDLLASLDQI